MYIHVTRIPRFFAHFPLCLLCGKPVDIVINLLEFMGGGPVGVALFIYETFPLYE